MNNDLQMHNPPHPGEILKELYIEPLGITISLFAQKIGVRRASVSNIINGKTGISPRMAIKLSKAFKTTPDLWMGLQLQYDLWKEMQYYDGNDVKAVV